MERGFKVEDARLEHVPQKSMYDDEEIEGEDEEKK